MGTLLRISLMSLNKIETTHFGAFFYPKYEFAGSEILTFLFELAKS